MPVSLDYESRSDKKLLAERNILTYGLALVAGIGLLTIAYYVVPKDSFLYFLFKEIGFALIVAIILVGTIDRFSRERHEAAARESVLNINRNLFYAIFKRYIPEKVFEEVERSVMESDVFRTKHELDYTLESIDGEYVRCLAQTSYELTSVVDSPIKHKVVVHLELPIDKKYLSQCYIDELKISGKVVSSEELAEYISRSDEHCSLEYPIEIEGRATVRISTRSRLLKKTTDVEVWASRIPSDGLELTVSTPTGGLNVCATANHSQKLELKIDNSVTKKWDLHHGIFPFQSIMFWWKPKASVAVLSEDEKEVVLGG